MFISLGADCGTANILNNLKLRGCSLPFDWVVTYEGITKIIKKEFRNYLPKSSADCADKKYLHNGVLFLHNSFPDDTIIMERRIVRFMGILKNPKEKITFIRKSHGEHHHTEYNNVINDIDDILALDVLLKSKYPMLKYEIHLILMCNKCFCGYVADKDIPETIMIHNISHHITTENSTTIENDTKIFNEYCKKLFDHI